MDPAANLSNRFGFVDAIKPLPHGRGKLLRPALVRHVEATAANETAENARNHDDRGKSSYIKKENVMMNKS